MKESNQNEIDEITIEGVPGKTPVKGEDYFTVEEIKEIADMATPKKMELVIPGIEVMHLVGPKGPKGDKGDRGDTGKDGKDGKDGIDGKDGKDGVGKDGIDGSPDTPEQIVEKINRLAKVIEWNVIKNVPDFFGKNNGGNGIGYISEASDVALSNLQNNEVLKWDSASNKWVNGIGGGGGTWGSITGTLSDQTDLQSALNAKQNTISLTTTGASGSATLIADTLNIPTYTLTGLGGVPTSRTLTINGTAYDLSADRSWTITTGVSALAAIGATPNANGATISGSTLNLQPASASFGGVVTTGTQTFAGLKTFDGGINTGTITYPGMLLATTTGGFKIRNTNATGYTARFVSSDDLSQSAINILANQSRYALSLGTSYINGNWVRLSPAQVIIENNAGALTFAIDTGLSVDAGSYTPTERMRLTTTGLGIGGTPNAAAILDLTSTTKGLLLPRMTEAQRDAISSPVAGLMVYNTTTNKANLYTTAWEEITSA